MNAGLLALAGLATWQSLVALNMRAEKSAKYEAAEQYARSVNKPFLIVGGPLGSGITGHVFHFRAHGCGDVCLDIDAGACEGCNTTVADVRSIPYGDKHFGSVFVSHVLEHLPTAADAISALNELHRVADKVFICVPLKSFIYAWFVTDHHLWIDQVQDGVRVRSWGGEEEVIYQ